MEEEKMQNYQERSLTFADIFILVKKYFLQCFIIMFLCVLATSILAVFIAKPKYSASATIMVNYVSEGEGSVTNDRNALLYSLDLVDTVTEFSATKTIQKEVKKISESENDPQIEYNYAGGFSIKTEGSSLILTYEYVTKSSGEAAVKTVNTIVDCVISVANTLNEDGTERYSSLNGVLVELDEATTYVVKNTWPIFVAVGIFGGLFFSCLFLLIKFLLDDTIKSKSDLEKTTGFRVLAFIEDIEKAD